MKLPTIHPSTRTQFLNLAKKALFHVQLDALDEELVRLIRFSNASANGILFNNTIYMPERFISEKKSLALLRGKYVDEFRTYLKKVQTLNNRWTVASMHFQRIFSDTPFTKDLKQLMPPMYHDIFFYLDEPFLEGHGPFTAEEIAAMKVKHQRTYDVLMSQHAYNFLAPKI